MVTDPFITLDANMARSLADRQAYAELVNKPIEERVAVRKELADASTPGGFGSGDFTAVRLSEGKFIDLAIHKDTFLDDAAIRSDVAAETPLAWKTRYAPVCGIVTGGLYGSAPRHLYQTSDNYQFLQTFPVDVPEVTVPAVALTQDPAKLGQRDAGIARQAEAVRLAEETFLVNFMTQQPLGTPLGQSVYNYATGVANPYNGKTVYVVDPGVESGTYDTTNIINQSTEAGLTPKCVFEVITQTMLSDRHVRTIHVPKKGLPWRQLMLEATVVANASVFSAGQRTNPNLNSIPASEWEKLWQTDMSKALEGGLIISIFGETFKIKANNVLPQGVAIITTDEPAAEVYNVTGPGHSYELDVVDPRNPAFVGHIAKRHMAVAVPDPWVRNWFCLIFDTPTL
jgi:hypothetical protein